MLRRSPCHRGRVHFDFSEEVVKRLHTSTLRLELTPSFFCLCMLCLRVCLVDMHSPTVSYSLSLFMWSLQLCIYVLYYFKYGPVLAHLSTCPCHEFLSLSSGPLSYSDQVSSHVVYLHLQYHFLYFFSFSPLFSRLLFEFIVMICCYSSSLQVCL